MNKPVGVVINRISKAGTHYKLIKMDEAQYIEIDNKVFELEV
jgi:hypothetical protein